MATDITVPNLGESVSEAEIGQWLKQAGDTVEQDEPIAELETDKVTLEVNAPSAGVISEILVPAGETVAVGSVIGRVGEAAAGAGQAQLAASSGEAQPTPAGDGQAQPAASQPQGEAAAPPAGGRSGGATHDVAVPSMGESVSEATLGQWIKGVGDAVEQDEAIAELETDKVTLEVNAPATGTLAEQLVAAGDTVQVGTVVARVREGAGAPAKAAAPAASEPAAAPAKAEAETAPAGGTGAPAGGLNPNQAPRSGDTITRGDLERFLGTGPNTVAPEDLSPAVRTLVQEHDLDPTRIPPSGPGGRITKQDVMDVVEGRKELLTPQAPTQAPAPQQQPTQQAPAQPAEAKGGEAAKPVERVRMTRLRQTIAKRLKEAQNTAAMLSTFNEVDMSAVNDIRARYKEDFEKAHGTRLGMSSFFAKAVVQALKELPELNASIEGDEIVYHHYYDIGMAVSTPSGLMVPVVRDVDQKSMAEIESSLRELAKKGRDNKLKMDDLQGATFSMTNGGVFGSLLSTPIINPPQSGILGMHAIKERPVAVNGTVEIRPMMYVALSYDHRLVDGREAVTFLVRLKECLEDPARLLLQM
ncbi:2-oxoglutarate dehydrogenase E2 component [Limimonas halophila]|uniref:Dihydrolipoyllysine-residue succinyltransferase n=1 Tax=Limimonas halophila TaxID=1082479 RepID=A0A1G7T2T0_9PROT|nr:2-oxoglutarate dehydrogenase complex dihydrolipoyllysine-residue succinyltransferase [Limimonas halophila]SDG29528.1 2-oxoglutarate dehydrogenase E2 component [Limimonas halophila]